MELALGLLADNAHADPLGKLYILGEFRYIHTPQVPVVHPRMSVVVRIVASAAETRARSQSEFQLEIVDADGTPLAPRTPPLQIGFAPIGPAQRGMVQCQVILELAGVPLPHFGDYSIHIFVDGVHLGRIPFHVFQSTPGAPPAAPGSAPAQG